MRHINQRIDRLERIAESQFTRSIDDGTILEVLVGTIREPRIVRDALDGLLALIRPALNASLLIGVQALEFCVARGIDLPATGGVLDLCARSLLDSWRGQENKARDRWNDLEASVSQWIEEYEGGPTTSLSQREMRAYLLMNRAVPSVAGDHERTRVDIPPVLHAVESERLIGLVRPLEDLDTPDLPLLLWRNAEGQVETSWPGEREETWVPIDVGLEAPRYLLLAGPRSELASPSAARDDLTPLPRRIPANEPPLMSDEEIAKSTRRDAREFVWYSTEALDHTFLSVEPFLLASVVAGAQSLRLARAADIAVSPPQTAVNQAAHMLSYESTAAMPQATIDACGWAIPESDQYDFAGRRLTSVQHTKGSARGALIFRILEKYGLRFLRELRITDAEVPFASQRELEGLLTLVQPLQWHPDPDLPLLLWRDSNGTIRTSSSAISGQIRTIPDTPPFETEDLFLADQKSGSLIPERTIWAAEHYRPDGAAWRGRQFRRSTVTV